MKEFLFFVPIVILFFWLPGLFTLRVLRLRVEAPESFALPLIAGFLQFLLFSYILAWARLALLVIPVFLAMSFGAVRGGVPSIGIPKLHRMPLVLVLLMAIAFSLTMTTIGIGQTGVSYHTDDIIHLAYINELVHHFPPDNPGVSGIALKGYHFFSDFAIAMIHTMTGLSQTFLYFQGMPVLVSLLWGFGTYSFLFAWRKRIDTALWGVFLVFFGGSFAWWTNIHGHPDATLRSLFGIDQPPSALLNPPYALSVAIIIGALLFALKYFETKRVGWLVLYGLATGLAPMVKIYAGILLVVGFLFITLTDLIKKKFAVIWIGALTALLIALSYGVFAGKGGYLLWAPLWAPHKVLTDSMPWYGYDEKLYTFGKFGMWWRIAGVELYGIWLFVIGNLGTRALGLAALVLASLLGKKLPSRLAGMTILLMGTALVIPLLFLQSIKVFEIIQMGWYYPFFAALLGAMGISWLVQKTPSRMGKFLVALVFIAMTVPSWYEDFRQNVYHAPHRIRTSLTTDPYLKTISALSSDTHYDATVLELPTIQTPATHLDILSWYRVTLPYPAALGNKRSFFHSQNIDFPNVPLEQRTKLIGDVLTLERMTAKEATYAATLASVQDSLSRYNIRYVITQFPLTRLTPTNLLLTSLPYYLYSFNP